MRKNIIDFLRGFLKMFDFVLVKYKFEKFVIFFKINYFVVILLLNIVGNKYFWTFLKVIFIFEYLG